MISNTFNDSKHNKVSQTEIGYTDSQKVGLSSSSGTAWLTKSRLSKNFRLSIAISVDSD